MSNNNVKIGKSKLFNKKFIILIVTALLLAEILYTMAYAESKEEIIKSHIKHADTYFWFSMAEKGNMYAFNRGKIHLNKAEKLLKSSQLSPKIIYELEHEISALKIDYKNQIEVHFDTLYGVFPLVRLLVPSLFVDALTAGTFELVDDPSVMAATAAGFNMCRDMLKKWSAKPQLNVVLTSIPDNKALENELLYIFNSFPKFFAHNYREVVATLHPKQLKNFNEAKIENKITPDIRKRFCEAFQTSDFILVVINEKDKVNKDHFYIIEGRIYNYYNDQPTHFFYHMGFSRDRNAQLKPIIISNITFFILAMILFFLFESVQNSRHKFFSTISLVPVTGFLTGRIMPWFLIPILSSIAPVPETLAKLSFWWPCAMGAALFLGPVLFHRFASIRIRSFSSMFDVRVNSSSVFTTIALGVCAYMAGPIFIFLESRAIEILIPLLLSSGLMLCMLGYSFDQKSKQWKFIFFLSVIISLGLGAAVAHLESFYLWICTGFAIFPLIFFLKLPEKIFSDSLRLKHKSSNQDSELPKSGDIPYNVHELIKRTKKPEYQRIKTYDKAIKKAEPAFINNKTIFLLLAGPAGAGKTATADEIVKQISDDIQKPGKEMVLLLGECSQRNDNEKEAIIPYEPFQKALSDYFNINEFAPAEGQMKQIDSVLEGLFGSMVPPVAGLLLPEANYSTNPANNQEDVFASVAQTIKKLAETKATVLYIDDVHWIDEASNDLLFYLFKELSKEEVPLLILLTSREEGLVYNNDSIKNYIIPVNEPEPEEKIRILSSSLGMNHELAALIVEEARSSHHGGLFWLFRVVAYLAEKGFFIHDINGFKWSDKFKSVGDLPIPDDFRTAVEQQINKVSEYFFVLECAACIGREFNVDLLATSLYKSRLKVLQILDQIANETGIIFDNKGKDDEYKFSSSFMLEIIRSKINFRWKGPKASDVPQRIREYHALMAVALEKILEKSPNRIYEVAKHYYAAGRSHSSKAVDYCLKAAHTARKNFLYDQAREYVGMAGECADEQGLDSKMEVEYLLIGCDQAHVQKKNHKEGADKCWQFINENTKVPVRLIISAARACFDHACADNYNQYYFSKAVEAGEMIIEKAKSAVEKAEGYHFTGISLPDKDYEERHRNLQKALSLVGSMPEDNIDAQALIARIANSLAALLSSGPLKNEKEAERLFYSSIDIKKRREINDTHGLAISHGGIGRLYKTIAGNHQKDGNDDEMKKYLNQAREHFMEDMKYSEKINQQEGVALMYRLIAECDILEKKFENAFDNYQKAYDLNPTGISNKFYVLTGLLAASQILGKENAFNKAGQDLLNLINEKDSIQPDCSENILEILNKKNYQANLPWIPQLKVLVEKAAKQ